MIHASLADRIRQAPRVADAGAAARGLEALAAAAPDSAEWLAAHADARALLEGTFACAPYLARAARRRAPEIVGLFSRPPEESLARLVEAAHAAGAGSADAAELGAALRRAKLDLHLLTALADLGGVWGLAEVTAALSRFADAALEAAIAGNLRLMGIGDWGLGIGEGRTSKPQSPVPNPQSPTRGFVALAMGKLAAYELNYSSDIDLIVLFERESFAAGSGRDPQDAASALTRAIVRTLQEPTAEGYVFRVDLRLRPDPGATPLAINQAAALRYYESLGQTWERAALIKARACAGDLALGEAFLAELQPFIWRRSLDYAAIDDLHAMKRQIQEHADVEGPRTAGADVKRGYGGIREIEFFVQGHQLINGGRDPKLRSRATLDALGALAAAGHVTRVEADALQADYVALRMIEHRIQMLEDHQSHRTPVDDAARDRVAALAGAASLAAFDADLEARFRRVRGIVDELFREASPGGPSSSIGGAAEDSEALAPLREKGFAAPERVVDIVRGWRSGRVPATRSPRARGLLDRVLPQILDAAAATGAPDVTFTRFAEFFEKLPAGVQTLSLFAAEPNVLRAVIDVLSLAPKLGAALARRPELLDVMLDADFGRPVAQTTEADAERVARAIAAEPSFEGALNAARRGAREARFRIGVQALMGVTHASEAGKAQAVLADAVVSALLEATQAEMERRHGPIDARYAILGLGKLGGRELSAASDLDLMAVYDPLTDGVKSRSARPLEVDVYFVRLTQRLITALSAHTEEGDLYEIDMQLRPSGKSGPIAVRLAAFEAYYAHDAWTWELMALTRARVVAGDAVLGDALTPAIRERLLAERDPAQVFKDAAEMRARMAAERPARGEWDMKLAPGGLVDVEFTIQALEIAHAHAAPDALSASSGEALRRLAAAGVLGPQEAQALEEALTLQLDLTQALSVAVEGVLDPATAPPRLKDRLVRIGGTESFEALEHRLRSARAAARAVFERRILAAAG
jgi:glutamate-ammonia-ligase adenylyltransferase